MAVLPRHIAGRKIDILNDKSSCTVLNPRDFILSMTVLRSYGKYPLKMPTGIILVSFPLSSDYDELRLKRASRR
ncbi:hypothetical protein [Rhizobium wenxiniae]|uniref:hypothetical protein n=1 Tax=Rhizobium wenxiniae TaxID=1737357 RepID=UPI001CB7A447|nr:hypothetical protein [Rhizobium wenxiniae]